MSPLRMNEGKERGEAGREIGRISLFTPLLLASWWGANALGGRVEVRKYFCLVKITQMKEIVFMGSIDETVNILEQLIKTKIKALNLGFNLFVRQAN